MNKAWLGIDTSNYTTSVSAITEDGRLYNIKIPLTVKSNERGLRQSDAVFLHTKNLPQAMQSLMREIKNDYTDSIDFQAVGVSTRPRPIEGSYMPCFLSGVSVANGISCAADIPMFGFSHQEGHIRAALYGANADAPDMFYSFHLSGGTCELLEVRRDGVGFTERIIADSADITLGQLVDRTGVAMGLNFPCGVQLEKLAENSSKNYKPKIKGDVRINLAGFENITSKMLADGEAHEDIASYVFCVVREAVKKMLEKREDTTLPVLFAGGVSGSLLLQKSISEFCNALFSPSDLTSDNAVGIALMTKEKFLKESK